MTPFLTSVLLRVAHVMGTLPQFIERLQVVRYHPGQFYKSHQDFLLPKRLVASGGQRCKTLFVYLNDLPEAETGGRTQFTNLDGGIREHPAYRDPSHTSSTVDSVPKVGCGVLWANMLPNGDVDFRTTHQGTPLTSSVKYGLNVWARTVTQSYRVQHLQRAVPDQFIEDPTLRMRKA